MHQTKVWVFFYGSYMNFEVLRQVDFVPDQWEAARLALCYMALEMDPRPAANDYVDRIVDSARAFGFPGWYITRLESFRH
ncbi:MAG TPA: hypothetical protein VH702_09665 [Vicinamibacterales bacterium]|jgi:hypothetical protein